MRKQRIWVLYDPRQNLLWLVWMDGFGFFFLGLNRNAMIPGGCHCMQILILLCMYDLPNTPQHDDF